MIGVYTKLVPSSALVALSDRNRYFVHRRTSFAPDFLSALESASVVMSNFHAHYVLQFVDLNGLKRPIYKSGPLSDINEISQNVHSALT